MRSHYISLINNSPAALVKALISFFLSWSQPPTHAITPQSSSSLWSGGPAHSAPLIVGIIYNKRNKVLGERYHHDGDVDGWEEPLSLVFTLSPDYFLQTTTRYLHDRMFKLSIIIKTRDRMGVHTILARLCEYQTRMGTHDC